MEKKNRISYNDSFFSVEGDVKVAMKLTENEKAAFGRVLEFAFRKMIKGKLEQAKKFDK